VVRPLKRSLTTAVPLPSAVSRAVSRTDGRAGRLHLAALVIPAQASALHLTLLPSRAAPFAAFVLPGAASRSARMRTSRTLAGAWPDGGRDARPCSTAGPCSAGASMAGACMRPVSHAPFLASPIRCRPPSRRDVSRDMACGGRSRIPARKRSLAHAREHRSLQQLFARHLNPDGHDYVVLIHHDDGHGQLKTRRH
jgi:hypothetical protein